MAKPDDRSDNVEKLARMIENTEGNYREAKDFLKAHGEDMSGNSKAQIKEKNHRREEAIESLRSEIKDEAHDANKRN